VGAAEDGHGENPVPQAAAESLRQRGGAPGGRRGGAAMEASVDGGKGVVSNDEGIAQYWRGRGGTS
jgi:hypothetical protein